MSACLSNRRAFMAALGGAVAWPLMAPAQQPMVPTVGFINAGSPKGYGRALASFHKGLSEAGYVEGHNVAIQYRWAEGQYDRLLAQRDRSGSETCRHSARPDQRR
jgi:putative ABC transport system substrate-binding protein